MARSKTIASPTFEDRLNAAFATADAAVSHFDLVAGDLERAARDKQDIAVDITYEIDSLQNAVQELHILRATAEEAAEAASAKASNIRALVSA